MQITCVNVYSASEVCSSYTSIQGKRFEGRFLPPSKAENDSSSPSASRAILHPNLYVDICGVSCPNMAVPFMSMTVLPCLLKLYVGQTTLLHELHPGESASWLDMHTVSGDWLRTILG